MQNPAQANSIIKPSKIASPGRDLLMKAPSFTGHQTFALRSSWLKKGIDELRTNLHIFADEDALVKLGVGKNMVVAIRHWLLVTKLANSLTDRGVDLQPTELGDFLLADDGVDPYLEDPATLWILHWNLCGPGSIAFTWAFAFNIFREWEWTSTSLANAVSIAARAISAKTSSQETVERDVNVFIQTYLAPSDRGQNAEDGLDCPLRELGLVRSGFGGNQQLTFAIGPKPSLPPSVFAWALIEFWQLNYLNNYTIAVRDIVNAEGSPGVVFKLDEDSTLAYLDQLEELTSGVLRFEDTPLVRQVIKTSDGPLKSLSLLRHHYVAAPNLA
ncbi:DUF4007 family protein [Adhaeribacter rhizoryzae]|uniref:DUF4007 family protein n=1 Tax=Adhaeribacter rhizoryzae TaxID=2607907 RepID=A0A5M6DQ92_9BACT|nr:DUF4007 family protein [Adhaeribacter rhizoryzae]KAA5548350.1 DUF4007 family protein [Adhaeribacter rhizoryzae]